MCSVPAFAKDVLDIVGAGNAFHAIAAPLVRAGGAMRDLGLIGNVAGALKTAIVGHRELISKSSLVKSLIALLK